MLIAKAAILQAFEDLGEYDLAEEAALVLPDQVDTEHHLDLFLRFSIDPRDLLGHLRRVRPASSASADQGALGHKDARIGSEVRPRREPSSS